MSDSKNNSFKVLLIQKDPKKRSDISSRLRTQGFQVEAPSDGMHAIHLSEDEEQVFHAVLLTSHMEDMSALEIVSIIRTFKTVEDLPIAYYYDSKSPLKNFTADEFTEAGAMEAIFAPHNFNTVTHKLAKFATDIQKKALTI